MTSWEDGEVGRIAVEENLVPAEAILDARRIQSQYRDLGIASKGLGEILLEEGYLSRYLLRTIYRKVQPRSDLPRLGGYEILAKIAEGSTGTVYQARQVSLDRLVAVKILSERLTADPVYVERFQREARAAGRLHHSNIVSAIEVGESAGRRFLVMEYVEGHTVDERIKERGPFPEKEALELSVQVARALDHAHRAGIVHRDIKPANILVTPEGVAKLCDLGLVRPPAPDQTLTRTGYTHGTPHYMSPEQVLGARDVDGRSDIYSLGATLYKMLTGSPPYAGESAAAILVQHLRGPLVPPRERRPEISPAADLLVRRMMSRDPERRHPNAAALMADLSRIAAGEAETMVKELAPYVLEEPPEKESGPPPRRWLAASLAANAVLGVALLGVLLFGLLPSRMPEAKRPPASSPPPAGAALDPAPVGGAERRELEALRAAADAARVERERYREFWRVQEAEARGFLARTAREVGLLLAEGRFPEALSRIDAVPEWVARHSGRSALESVRERIRDEMRTLAAGALGAVDRSIEKGDFGSAEHLVRGLSADPRFAPIRSSLEERKVRIVEAMGIADERADLERAEGAYWSLFEQVLARLADREYEGALADLDAARASAALAPLSVRLEAEAAGVRLVRARIFEGAREALVACEEEVTLTRRKGGRVRGHVKARPGGGIRVEEDRPGERTMVDLMPRDLSGQDLLTWADLDPAQEEDALALALFSLYERNWAEAEPRLLAVGRRDPAAYASFAGLRGLADAGDWKAAEERLAELAERYPGPGFLRLRREELAELESRIEEGRLRESLGEHLRGRLVELSGMRVTLEYRFAAPAELDDWREVDTQDGAVGPMDRAWRIAGGNLVRQGNRPGRVLVHRLPLATPLEVEFDSRCEDGMTAGFDLHVATDASGGSGAVFHVVRPFDGNRFRAQLYGLGGQPRADLELDGFPSVLVARLDGGEQTLEILGAEPLVRRGLPAAAAGRVALRALIQPLTVIRIRITGTLPASWEEALGD
ncbi:MAG: serine/threonine protein kinase [Planctomycetes bacterium]|nr:serine/threonine protein kinase [Planctomycetota bacterium]